MRVSTDTHSLGKRSIYVYIKQFQNTILFNTSSEISV